MVKVAVGSSNPVKVGAARRIFSQFLPEAELVAVDVPSGVSHQPVGEAETDRGALGRARTALAVAAADYGVGLEGGVEFRGEECWIIGTCAVVHRDGRFGIGRSAEFRLPPDLAEGVRAGNEVGPLVDRLTGIKNSKQKGGVIGFLTNGLVVREDLFASMVAAALVPFFHPDLYRG